ncbi:MAG: hypothetical protein GXP22_00330 [Gammaproteobacteria bacterium]|nr:hypothetical protein [Gammaproteobacteria bacterium]
MNEPLKQRLVGAAVLIGLAIIFVPSLIDRSDPVNGDTLPAIPQQPKLKVRSHLHVLKLPPPIQADKEMREVAVDVIKKAPAMVKKVAVEVKKAVVEIKKAPVLKKKIAKLDAWVVQLASFKKKENAYTLRDRLRKKRYDAFVQRIKMDGGVVYRVRIGPELKRESAEKLLKRLMKETKLKGIVKKHSRT